MRHTEPSGRGGSRMRLRRRILWGLAALVAVVAVVLAVAALRIRDSGLPLRDGKAPIAGLASSATVRFDVRGVPHVEAANERDLAAALGYLHANDRMTQMEIGRRAASGRLAEVLGEAALSTDIYFRTLQLDRTREQLAAAAGPRSRTWLEGYADGVNAWLDARSGALPPGLRLLSVEPEPWTPADSLSFALLMARDLSFWNERPEEERFQWLHHFGPEITAQLIGGDEPLHVPPGILALAEGATVTADDSDRSPPPDAAPGSNNWALTPSKTASGGALVANDPHLGLFLPAVWYQVQLRCPTFEVAGMSIPGTPGVVIGRGRHVAWAFTNVMLDDHDLFFEQLDATGEQVRRGDGWVPVVREEQTIQVRGGPAHTFLRRRTDRGVLLEADPERGLPARSLTWAAQHPADPLLAVLMLAEARIPEDVAQAMPHYASPAQNLMAAFDDGTLLQTVWGGIPERGLGEGRLPSPGWDPAYGWKGLRDRTTNPWTVIAPDTAGSTSHEDDNDPTPPAPGPPTFLVTANADIRPPDYPLPLIADFLEPQRGDRIRDRLAAHDGWDVASTTSVQTDAVSTWAPELLRALSGGTGIRLEDDAARAYETLIQWDGSMTLQGPSALFGLAVRHLLDAAFGDESEHLGLKPFANRLRLLALLQGTIDPLFFDDRTTPETEDRSAVVQRAFDTAWRTGTARWGEDVAAWDYGALHTLTLRHRLDPVPVLGRWLRRGPYPVPGSATTPLAFGSAWQDGVLPVTYGPSMRWIVDWGSPETSWAIVPGGQSGHGRDPHYDDQIDDYLAGVVYPAPWTPDAIERATVSTLVLHPTHP